MSFPLVGSILNFIYFHRCLEGIRLFQATSSRRNGVHGAV